MIHDPIVPFSKFDVNKVIVDRETIQTYNPQRFEMAQLDAIVYEDFEVGACVGYKDVTHEEFWIRGHMPEMPLMPGVIMCEVAAQLSAYYAVKSNLLNSKIVGLGGLKDIRIRNVVHPGQRLVIMLVTDKLRPNVLVSCRFQGFVDKDLVIDGGIIGVPIKSS